MARNIVYVLCALAVAFCAAHVATQSISLLQPVGAAIQQKNK